MKQCANSTWKVLWASDPFHLRTPRAIWCLDQASREHGAGVCHRRLHSRCARIRCIAQDLVSRRPSSPRGPTRAPNLDARHHPGRKIGSAGKEDRKSGLSRRQVLRASTLEDEGRSSSPSRTEPNRSLRSPPHSPLRMRRLRGPSKRTVAPGSVRSRQPNTNTGSEDRSFGRRPERGRPRARPLVDSRRACRTQVLRRPESVCRGRM